MADQVWVGDAADVKQEDTITAADTWAQGDTATVTCNNQNLVLTIGTNVTTANVADMIARMINAKDRRENRLGDETRNFGGQEIPEFTEMEAFVSGSVVTVKSKKAGIPFTITVSESTAGDGTITLATGGSGSSVACTGRHFADNTANYSGGALPGNGDTLYVDRPAADILYGLDGLTDSTNVVHYKRSGVSIGLPPWNPLGYPEYRQQFLDVEPAASGTVTHKLYLGDGNAEGQVRIDLGTNNPTAINIFVAGAPARQRPTGRAGVELVGGLDTINLYVEGGSVDIGCCPGENASSLAKTHIAGTSDVRVGSTAAYDNVASTIRQHGGSLFVDTAISGANNDIVLHDGVMRLGYGRAARDFEIRGGTLIPIGANTANHIDLYAGTLDLRETVSTFSVTDDLEVWAGSKLYDPAGLISEIDFNGCTPQDIEWTTNKNLSSSWSAL